MEDLLTYLREEVHDSARFSPKQGKNPRRKKQLAVRRKENNRRKPFSYNGVIEKRYHLDTFEGCIHGKSSRFGMREQAGWWGEGLS